MPHYCNWYHTRYFIVIGYREYRRLYWSIGLKPLKNANYKLSLVYPKYFFLRIARNLFICWFFQLWNNGLWWVSPSYWNLLLIMEFNWGSIFDIMKVFTLSCMVFIFSINTHFFVLETFYVLETFGNETGYLKNRRGSLSHQKIISIFWRAHAQKIVWRQWATRMGEEPY